MVSSRLEKLQGMLEADPQDQMLRYMLAMEFEKSGDNESSLELFQGLMNDDTPHVPAFLMAGQQLASIGRTEEAKSVYQAGIQQARAQSNDHAAGEMGQFLSEL